MSEFRMDRFTTVLGPVDAIRLTEENIRDVAEFCGGSVVDHTPLDHPDVVHCILLRAYDRHLKPVLDNAYPGEWVVLDSDNHISVYADKLFLSMVRHSHHVPFGWDEERNEEIVKIMNQLMEYQDHVTQRGGTTDETKAAAELAARQVWWLVR